MEPPRRETAGSVPDSVTMEHAAGQVGPEFFPDISDGATAEPGRAAPGRLLPGRRARGKPGILDQVVDRVAGDASPRRRQVSVGTMREEHGFQRVADPRLDAAFS